MCDGAIYADTGRRSRCRPKRGWGGVSAAFAVLHTNAVLVICFRSPAVRPLGWAVAESHVRLRSAGHIDSRLITSRCCLPVVKARCSTIWWRTVG